MSGVWCIYDLRFVRVRTCVFVRVCVRCPLSVFCLLSVVCCLQHGTFVRVRSVIAGRILDKN